MLTRQKLGFIDRAAHAAASGVLRGAYTLAANPVPIQLPIGKEENFKGVVDLVEMKAIIWDDESLGAKYEVIDIPADLVDQAQEYREALSRGRLLSVRDVARFALEAPGGLGDHRPQHGLEMPAQPRDRRRLEHARLILLFERLGRG